VLPAETDTKRGPIRRALAKPAWRWAGAAVLVVVLGAFATLALAWPHVQGFIPGPGSAQFHHELDPALIKDYPHALGVAHNAGNSLELTKTALAHRADVIEVDIISVRGQLVAGRDQPLQWLNNHLFPGPTLDQVWAAAAPVIKLDLNQEDRPFLDDLVTFLNTRQYTRKVMISTRDADALEYLRPRLPAAELLFTLASPEAIDQLRSDRQLLTAVNGVSVFQGLLNAGLVGWLHRNHLLALAWTINDVDHLNIAVRLGVDGVTTANLAILEVLG
jgi:Glycerophosphoryl diester phosphodiesterase family